MDMNPSADADTNEHEVPTAKAGTVLLLLGALGLMIGGAGLVAVPLVARSYAWIVSGFAKHGVYGAPVALAGIVVLGLWIVARSREVADRERAESAARDSQERAEDSQQALVLDQLASDLALTRGGMQELRVEFVYLKDLVQSAQRDGVDPTTGIDEAQAAIFRLAASMDQLGGRLEQRLKAQDSAVHEVMALLRSELSTTTNSLMDLRVRIEQGIQDASTSSVQTRTHADGEEDQMDFSEVDEIELESGYEPAPDDLHVEVELEQDNGLGLLDQLDDLGSPRRTKTSASIRPSIPRTNTYADLGLDAGLDLDTGRRVPGALPSRRDAEADEVDEKLALLRALMSDPTVRHALEAARHRA